MQFDPTMPQSSMPISMAPQGLYAGDQSFMSPVVQQGLQAPQMTMPQGNRDMEAYRIMAQGLQGMGRSMQMPMPSGNTAQIMRDQSRPQFVGTPQQQMAMALRRR